MGKNNIFIFGQDSDTKKLLKEILGKKGKDDDEDEDYGSIKELMKTIKKELKDGFKSLPHSEQSGGS